MQAEVCTTVGVAEALLQLARRSPSTIQLDLLTHFVYACCQLHLDVAAAQEVRLLPCICMCCSPHVLTECAKR